MKRFGSVIATLCTLFILGLAILPVRAASTNLIANPSVETAQSPSKPDNWTADSWGTNNAVLTYQNNGHTGSKSVQTTITSYTNGDAKWIPDAVSVNPNMSYVYTDYYESNVATELDAQFTDTTGKVTYQYLSSVNPSATWQQTGASFTTPANVAKVSILHILPRVGVLQADDFSLAAATPTPPPTSGNLVANPSVETALIPGKPDNWTADSWGTNSATLTYQDGGHTGNKSLLINMTSYTSGDAKWIPDPSSVTGGNKYTYSDYYQSNVATELDAKYTDASGKVTYAYLGAVPASNSWKQLSNTFAVPTGVTQVSILHLIANVGWLQTDDYSLTAATPTPPPSSGNLIANPSFETANGANPANWSQGSWGANNATFSYSTNAHTGSKSATVAISSYTDGDAKWFADPVAVTPGQTYTYSDWYQSSVTSHVVAVITDTTGNTTYTTLPDAAASTTWKQYSTTLTAPANATKITIYHLLNAAGSLTIDDVSLTPVQVTTSNLITNGSVETVDPTDATKPLDWTHNSWGTNAATFSYVTGGHTGTRSLKTQITSYTNGAAYWENASIPVTGGKMYNYTDFFKSNIVSGVDATVTMSDGSVQYLHVADAYPSPNSWTKVEAQFTVPANAVSIIFQHNIYQVGWLQTDDYSLTPFSYQGFKRPIITITDDDSYASFYTYGLPILQKYGLTSTDYIITSYINNVQGYMSSAQVKGLYAAGQEIGSHSVDHPDLTTLSASAMDAELKNSQSWLQNLLGVPIPNYAAPYGATNNQVVTDAKNYYQSYRSVEEGYNAKNNFDPYNIQVQNADNTTTLAQVQSWINQAEATNTWLVLVYHQVDPNTTAAGQYNNAPSDFDAQMSAVAAAKTKGVAVETIAQALAELKPQL